MVFRASYESLIFCHAFLICERRSQSWNLNSETIIFSISIFGIPQQSNLSLVTDQITNEWVTLLERTIRKKHVLCEELTWQVLRDSDAR